MDILGNRKLIITLLGFVCATVLALVGKLDQALYVDLCKWLAGFFIGGNAVEHIASAVSTVPDDSDTKEETP